ncbi:TetR family transcriptional regulator [Azorhizobium oxalatiphilum]|uniref:TetR family transcriptional regulator n=1 Tax=Azorhizobium oxalatiphilum TaxID=980631 RepID=A0A917FFR7_9HYPH|nr:TetR/AcrR family transcriptional regulator [Azorhizobium oxalatiphilum]GGF74886.1 TetR family transcriptional regulator [Azorhizobium oxalatiphilum]
MQNSDSPSSPTPARGRGRPRAFDRAAALAAATCLFWQKGFAAASISDLTEVMGINSPSLYAAFGSKEALYAEALAHYQANYEQWVWGNFRAAPTARAAVAAYLMDSAAGLTAFSGREEPLGCMVALSAVGSEGHAELGEQVRAARACGLAQMEQRLARAVTEGEIPGSVDVAGLARLLVSVQVGMSVQARDGASREDLERVARITMQGWDGLIAG